jgi:hypothetical protein
MQHFDADADFPFQKNKLMDAFSSENRTLDRG